MDQKLKKSQKKQQQQQQANLTKKLNSSTEDLSLEERFLLRSGIRQDPQGQDSSPTSPSHCSSSTSVVGPPNPNRGAFQQNSITNDNNNPKMMKSNQSTQRNLNNNNNNNNVFNNSTSMASASVAGGTQIMSSSSSDRNDNGLEEDDDESDTSTSYDDDEISSRNNRQQQNSRNHSHDRHFNRRKVKNSSSNGGNNGGENQSPTGTGTYAPAAAGIAHSKSKNMSLDSTNSGHSAYNTLIIHQNNSSLLADTWLPASHEFTSIGMGNSSNNSNNSNNNNENRRTNSPASASGYSNNKQIRSSVSPSLDPPPYPSNRGGATGAGHGGHYSQMSPNLYENIEYQGNSGGAGGGPTSSELSDIPRDYLDQLTVLKHLAKDLQQEPPTSGSNLKRSESFSRSQPDLTQQRQYNNVYIQEPSRPQPQQPSSLFNWQQASSNEDMLPSVQILEILMRENSNLKAELMNARRKINTINKLEAELTNLQSQHAALFESAERRESLERTARVKLSSELKRLTSVNRELLSSSGSLQNLAPFTGNLPVDIEMFKKELSNKDLVIAQLISQNKELAAFKERQEIELTAQRATLAEQRTHIEILDSALTNAQTNVLRLEEECRKKQEYVDKVSHLQRAMSSLQLTNDKREQSEKKIRSQLEGEINDLKSKLTSINNGPSTSTTNNNGNGPTNSGISQSVVNPGRVGTPTRTLQSPPPYPGTQLTKQQQQGISVGSAIASTSTNSESTTQAAKSDAQLQQLQEKLKASEDQISHLNSQVAKWENVFSAADFQHPKQSQNSAASTPNSWTRDGSNNSQTNHFFGNDNSNNKNLPSSNEDILTNLYRVSDLEWKIKDLESRLVEKDAVIRILQTGGGNGGGCGVASNISSPISRNSPVQFSPISSNSSSLPYQNSIAAAVPPPNYRESPCYSQASTIMMAGYSSPVQLPGMSMGNKHQIQQQQHHQHLREASGSLSSILDSRRSPSVSGAGGPGGIATSSAAASAMYAKMGLMQQQLKCESEPPSYANIPLKMRLGGSGSSLMKTSNESLQHGFLGSSGGSGNSPAGSISNSGPGSVSSTSGASATGNNNNNHHGKSIDDQLKELDTQLLSKGTSAAAISGEGANNNNNIYTSANLGTLKVHSGLCCLPGFINSETRSRKEQIPKSLLESLNTPYNLAAKNPLTSLLIMPPKPPSTYYTQNHGNISSNNNNNNNTNRTNSGPPFISSAAACAVTTSTSLSNSVDSVLCEQGQPGGNKPGVKNATGGAGVNVFTPAVGLPKGLPPKSPTNAFDSTTSSSSTSAAAGKSRSLERNKGSCNTNDPVAGKYTVIMYDAARCKSLDRKDIKNSNNTSIPATASSVNSQPTDNTNIISSNSPASTRKKAEKESKSSNLKSSVSSKAAFFGQLLTRRSPSPSRGKKDKDNDKEAKISSQGGGGGVRFPFSSNESKNTTALASNSAKTDPSASTAVPTGQTKDNEVDVTAILLDRQGRSSQSSRNRISSKWSSSNTLESVEEQSGSESSPWIQRKHERKAKSTSREDLIDDNDNSNNQQKDDRSHNNNLMDSTATSPASAASLSSNNNNNSNNKKWGRIVKTPFGLRYTFGSGKVTASNVDSEYHTKK